MRAAARACRAYLKRRQILDRIGEDRGRGPVEAVGTHELEQEQLYCVASGLGMFDRVPQLQQSAGALAVHELDAGQIEDQRTAAGIQQTLEQFRRLHVEGRLDTADLGV